MYQKSFQPRASVPGERGQISRECDQGSSHEKSPRSSLCVCEGIVEVDRRCEPFPSATGSGSEGEVHFGRPIFAAKMAGVGPIPWPAVSRSGSDADMFGEQQMPLVEQAGPDRGVGNLAGNDRSVSADGLEFHEHAEERLGA